MVQVGCTINYGRRGLWKETVECACVDYPRNVGENELSSSLDPEFSGLLPIVGLWRSWERASMAWKRSSVRSRPGPPISSYSMRPALARNARLVPVNRRLPTLLSFSSLLFLGWSFLGSAAPASAANWTVHAQPTKMVNGAPVLFQVKPPARLESLNGTWLGHDVSFSFDSTSKTWFALAGVSFDPTPGTY